MRQELQQRQEQAIGRERACRLGDAQVGPKRKEIAPALIGTGAERMRRMFSDTTLVLERALEGSGSSSAATCSSTRTTR